MKQAVKSKNAAAGYDAVRRLGSRILIAAAASQFLDVVALLALQYFAVSPRLHGLKGLLATMYFNGLLALCGYAFCGQIARRAFHAMVLAHSALFIGTIMSLDSGLLASF